MPARDVPGTWLADRLRIMRLLVVALVISATTSARADDPGPRWAAGLDYTAGYGGRVADLDYRWRLEAGGFLRLGDWQATVSVPFAMASSDDVLRDGHQLSDVAVGLRLAYRLMLSEYGFLSLGVGIERHWMIGGDTVTRACHVTGTCVAGTYMETPSYRGWSPQLRLGLGLQKLLPNMVMAASIDLIGEAVRVDVPGGQLRGYALLAGVTINLGGGPKR